MEASGLPPAMVKAYHSAGPRLNLDDMRALELRNVSPRQVRDVIGFVKDPRDVASIKDASEVPLELLQEFYGSAEGSGYRREEIAAVAQLHRAGVKTPANVRAFLAGSTAPDWFSHPEGALVAAGRIFGSGVTHEKYHALIRSGVPVDRVADFKDHADPWEAGKPFREAWARTRRSWNRPDTWPYSKRQAATPPVPRA